MLAAILYGQENLRLETVADPTPGEGEVVIEVGAATTCGTDLKVWRRGGHARMLRPPTLFGHEAAGKIVALGKGVSNWQIGTRVVANNSAPCMECFFCKSEEFSLCPNLIWNNGTFAKYLKIPAAIVKHNMLSIPDNLPFELAAMTEPLACVLHGVARSHVKTGDKVVVLGDGAIGLMFVAKLACDLAAKIILFGGNDHRLEIGKKLGANKIFNYHQTENIPTLVKELTAGYGADVVIEATGIPNVWETAISCARPGATVNLFGGCPRNTNINVSTELLHYSELTLKGVFHNTPYYVRDALSLIASGRIPFELLISEKQSLTNLQQVFQDMLYRKVVKVAMIPD
ncbi:MAG: zinc-binding dehydrogenase [Mastigocoleus sp.]